MVNKELFDFITRGNIEKSLYTTSIFLIENSKIEVLEDTLIDICSYIGTFINVKEVAKLNDIIISTKYLIENTNLKIADFFIVITKMCILCNIYNSNPVCKTGVIPIGKLREKIIDIFSEEFKLSSNGISKFEMIIPPTDSEAYILSIKIISSFIRIIKILDNLSSENANAIELISLKFKNCFDYIIRKKYIIQTKLNPSEHDPIYFLWGFIEILYNHEENIHGYYWLFSNNYSKKNKKNRIGLIYGCCVSIIYSYKKFISTNWNQKELNVINKTKEISNDLIKQVRNDLKSKNLLPEKEKKEININDEQINLNNLQRLSIFENFIPKKELTTDTNNEKPVYEDEFKYI
jgi:hypothetical protein